MNHISLSSNVGSLSRPTTESISSCSFFWISGYQLRYRNAHLRVVAVVSPPAENKSPTLLIN